MKVSIKQYAQLIYELEQETEIGNQASLLERLRFFIRKNRDGKKIRKIIRKYQELGKEREGRKDVVVISRGLLGDEAMKLIKEAVAEKISTDASKISVESKVDKSIEGGLIIKVENEVWDGSLKRKVERIRASLVN